MKVKEVKQPSRKANFCKAGVAIVFSMFLMAFWVGGPSVVKQVIKDKVREMAVLSESSADSWSQVPGKLNIGINRHFYFYDLLNAEEVLYFNATPEFVQRGPWVYKEHDNNTNRVYEKDDQGREVAVNYSNWQYFLPGDGGLNPLENVTGVNLGAVCAWSNMERPERPFLLTLILYPFFRMLSESIIDIAVATGVLSQIKGNQGLAKDIFFTGSGVSQETIDFIWNDNRFGLQRINTIPAWTRAAREGIYSDGARTLRRYFGLTFGQMHTILNGKLQSVISYTHDVLYTHFKCPTNPCDGKYLMMLQWAQQGVTMNPPAGGVPVDSILYGNDTAEGYPEIAYFHKKYFLPNINNSAEYQAVTFSLDLGPRLFNYTESGDDFVKNWDNLLHIGHMRQFYEIGDRFEQTQDESVFDEIVDRFGFDSKYQARVMWSWFNHLISEFAIRENHGGTVQIAAVGQLAGPIIYNGFTNFEMNLVPFMWSKIFVNTLNDRQIDCPSFFQASVQTLENSDANKVCNGIGGKLNETVLGVISSVCFEPFSQLWNDFRTNTSLTDQEIDELCGNTANVNSYAAINFEVHGILKKHYECPGNDVICPGAYIASKQFINTSITLNPPPNSGLPVADTTQKWDSKAFSRPMEFGYWRIKYKRIVDTFEDPNWVWTYEEAKRGLTFDGILNGVIVQKAVLDFATGNLSNFVERYAVRPEYFIGYMRYIMIELFLGGFTNTRTVQELLWGYEDPLLLAFKQRSPLAGGDPTINTILQLGQNMSYTDAISTNLSVQTGQSNITSYRKLVSLNGETNAKSSYTRYNGNTSELYVKDPWLVPVEIEGHDTIAAVPGEPLPDKLKFFMGKISRELELKSTGTQNVIGGRRTHQYVLSEESMMNKTNNPSNAIYFMDKWNGAFNLTAALRAPLFFSRPHFAKADAELWENVIVWEDENKTKRVEQDLEKDDVIANIEELTGSPLKVSVALQTNVFFKGDFMFPTNKTMLFPVFFIVGFGGLTEDQIVDMFRPLTYLQTFLDIFFWAGPILALLLLTWGIYTIHKHAKSSKASFDRSTALLESEARINDSVVP